MCGRASLYLIQGHSPTCLLPKPHQHQPGHWTPFSNWTPIRNQHSLQQTLRAYCVFWETWENECSLFQVKATSFLRTPGYRLSAHGNKLPNTDLLDFVNRMLICWGNFQAHPTPHRDRAPLILTQDCLYFPCAWTYNPRCFKTPCLSMSA